MLTDPGQVLAQGVAAETTGLVYEGRASTIAGVSLTWHN